MNKRIKYVVLCISLLCWNTVAFSLEIETNIQFYWNENSDLWKSYEYDYNDVFFHDALRKCASGGNYVCASSIGRILYNKNKYLEAYQFLIQASEKYDGDHDDRLCFMFSKGLGVLQSYDKAIKHGIKAAKNGDSHAAYNVSVAYQNKALTYNQWDQKEIFKYRYNFVRGYAWVKIALAMGYDIWADRDGNEHPLSLHLEDLMHYLARISALAEADKLASEICSSIHMCKR